MSRNITRRRFIRASAVAGAGISVGLKTFSVGAQSSTPKPAILGGSKANTASFPSWPIYDQTEEQGLVQALHSGKWGRMSGTKVAAFEQAYQKLTGAKHCVATASGTTALLTSLGATGIGPGDEVILPPYTFVATYNAIVFHYALPVFVDTDPETFQIDAGKIDRAITPATKAVLPVHIGGSLADMDKVMSVARQHKVAVIEDACQAHLAEWRGRGVGQEGHAGCISFQSSKNCTAGEGGAIVTNDEEFAHRCFNFHNHGRGRSVAGQSFTGQRGANFRMTEFQGGLLLAQLVRSTELAKTRVENATYLTKLLNEIPGIKPARMHEGCTRNSYHLYMFRYDKERFANMPRARFIEAMSREGFSCSPGYSPLNTDPYVAGLASNPHYRRIYGADTMDKWLERNRCPVNDKLCTEAVWFTQTTMLGSRLQMDQIAEAIRKIQAYAGDVAKA